LTPTDELRTDLRELLDEEIPEGGSDSDTRFTAVQVDSMLTGAHNVYAAAAVGWTRKAAKLQRELGRKKSYSIGQEKYDYETLKDNLGYALTMAQTYQGMAGPAPTSVSMLFDVAKPEVM